MLIGLKWMKPNLAGRRGWKNAWRLPQHAKSGTENAIY